MLKLKTTTKNLKLDYKKPFRIVLTGGGTVGHIKPIFVVKKALEERCREKNLKLEFLYIGSKNGPEAEITSKEKIQFKGISAGKLRRYFDLKNFIDPLKISAGFLQSISILLKYKPDVLFAKGGYVTSPVIYAASKLGIPIVIHESDVIMGLANKFAVKYADKVCLGFPLKYYKDLPIDKIVYSGNPVEKVVSCQLSVIRKRNIKNEKIQKLKTVNCKLKTILIMGGSQGSRFINQTAAAIMDDLTKKYQVIHVSGKNDYNWLKTNHWKNYKLYDFTDRLQQFIEQADLIVSRAGANSLAEISAAGKPAIIIPLPSAANNHQFKNAQVYSRANAVIMVTESKLSPSNLKDLIDRIMQDDEIKKLMSLATKNLYQPNSAKIIASEIMKIRKD